MHSYLYWFHVRFLDEPRFGLPITTSRGKVSSKMNYCCASMAMGENNQPVVRSAVWLRSKRANKRKEGRSSYHPPSEWTGQECKKWFSQTSIIRGSHHQLQFDRWRENCVWGRKFVLTKRKDDINFFSSQKQLWSNYKVVNREGQCVYVFGLSLSRLNFHFHRWQAEF